MYIILNVLNLCGDLMTSLKVCFFTCQLADLMSGKTSTEEFSCAEVEEYYMLGEKIVSSIMAAFNSSTNIFDCVGNVAMSFGKLLEDISKLVSKH